MKLNFEFRKTNALQARAYLDANMRNRKVKWYVVHRIARAMIAGAYKEHTGQTLVLSILLQLLDGQHRLLALIEASKTIPNIEIGFYFATGVADEDHDEIDTGTSRSPSDTFAIEGVKNHCAIPALIACYTAFKKGATSTYNTDKADRLTNSEMLDIYYEDENYWQAVNIKTLGFYRALGKMLSPSIVGGLYCLFNDINERDSEEFMAQLSTGVDVTNKVIYILRQKLIEDHGKKTRAMSAAHKHALIIKAWNVFRKRATVKQLKWDDERELFPLAI